ncbi:conjugal transfer protein [Ferrovum sp. JA12]|uniref:TrbG/VirB9 family P-type conjugative transfer protein n=1 Tax=Ferrovum sp. JA12 TaxID=1356299 RepID=UPI000702FE57|nr:TrbG/VirB9 family P-type conjugative transfer protein [Ferrovum sp. JA12]KRH78247.1 conjugal transfer protein [Ferrovum sp. JA12]
MKKTLPFLCFITVGLVSAALPGQSYAENPITNQAQVNKNNPRTMEESASLNYQHTGNATSLTTDSGEILYPYAHSHPTIDCAPLHHLCVIHLMDHEKINNLSLGDTVRWIVQTGEAGTRAVVLIKPTEDKLTTNLVITTNRGRIYYLNLQSTANHYIPMVGFYDPEEIIKHVLDQQEKITEQQKDNIATLPSVNPQDINFDYWCEGSETLPERVFSSLGKVFIQLPTAWIEGKAPVLFIVENGQEILTNYELNHHYYVVNHLFKEAHLIIGSGNNQKTITIHAGKRPLFESWLN